MPAQAAAVLTKGEMLGSNIRRSFVESLFLMSRSDGGWGSTQMASVVSKRHNPTSDAARRFFGLGGRRQRRGEE